MPDGSPFIAMNKTHIVLPRAVAGVYLGQPTQKTPSCVAPPRLSVHAPECMSGLGPLFGFHLCPLSPGHFLLKLRITQKASASVLFRGQVLVQPVATPTCGEGLWEA